MSAIDWPAVVAIVHELKLSIHLHPRWDDDGPRQQDHWLTFLIIPVPGYIESRCGPIVYADVGWLDICTRRETHRGRLVPPLVEDMRKPLIDRLQALKIPFNPHPDDSDCLRIAGLRSL